MWRISIESALTRSPCLLWQHKWQSLEIIHLPACQDGNHMAFIYSNWLPMSLLDHMQYMQHHIRYQYKWQWMDQLNGWVKINIPTAIQNPNGKLSCYGHSDIHHKDLGAWSQFESNWVCWYHAAVFSGVFSFIRSQWVHRSDSLMGNNMQIITSKHLIK